MAAARGGGIASKLAERFFYDFSLYDRYFAHKMSRGRYVALRHNLGILGGFYVLLNVFFPFNPSFATMGLSPKGYEGTWVTEQNKAKALKMYEEWKVTKDWKQQ